MCASPRISGTIAASSATSVSPTIRPVNRLPMMLSCVKVCSGGSKPIAASTAITAQVPVPHGERSTAASAKIVTFRKSDRSSDGGAVKIVP